MRVKPVRIAGGQEQLARAVGVGQFGLRGFKMLRRRHGPERKFLAGTADGRRRGLVALEQNGGNFNFFSADGFAGLGFSGAFGFQRLGRTAVGGGGCFGQRLSGGAGVHCGCTVGCLLPDWQGGCRFSFHSSNSLFRGDGFMAMKSLRRERGWRNGNFTLQMRLPPADNYVLLAVSQHEPA